MGYCSLLSFVYVYFLLGRGIFTWSILSFMTHTFNQMVPSLSLQSTMLFPTFRPLFILVLLPKIPIIFSKNKLPYLHLYKDSLAMLIFRHHFFSLNLCFFSVSGIICHYQGHELSPLIPKPPWETYIIISISLVRILCESK